MPVRIDGTVEPFFIDTGASRTTLSQDTADALGIARDPDHSIDMLGIGSRESHLAIGEVDRLALGDVTRHDGRFPIARFGQPMADGTTRVGGLIGADILSGFDVEIDIPGRVLTLWAVAGCGVVTPPWPGGTVAVPLHLLASGQVSVTVRIDGVPLALLLDTGAPHLLLSTAGAARAGISLEMLEAGRHFSQSGANDRAVTAWFHIFPRLELAGQVYGDVAAAIIENGRFEHMDGLLGVDFLKRGKVWISYGTGVFYEQK